jgi:hypothetical protein
MKVSILVPLVFGIFTKVSATPLTYGHGEFPLKIPQRYSHCSHHLDTKVCDGAVTLATIWIGEVEIKSVFCPNPYPRRNVVQQVLEPQTLSKNVCGAPCRFSHDFPRLDSKNLFLSQAPRIVSTHQEVAPILMIAMSSLILFALTVAP